MLRGYILDRATFVEPDHVLREVHIDSHSFEKETERIHEKVWIFCGHDSQIPITGDYFATQIGRQPNSVPRCRWNSSCIGVAMIGRHRDQTVA